MWQKITISLIALAGLFLTACPTPGTQNPAGTNADLSALAVDSGTLTPAFSASTTNYTLSVPNAITSVTVTGTKADANAIVSAPVTLNNLHAGVSQAAEITVTAQSGATRVYKVSVTRIGLSTKAITSLIFVDYGARGTIDDTNHMITATVPWEIDLASQQLTPTIAHTGTNISPASGSPQYFNNQLTYTVTAEDGSTQDYTVIVTVALPPDVTGLSAAEGYTQVELSWIPPAGSKFNGVEITAVPAITIVTVPKGTNKATVTGLTNGINYAFAVKSVDIYGKKSAGAITNATPSAFIVTYNENSSTGGSAPVDSTPHDWNTSVTVLENTGNLIRIPPAGTGEAYKFGGWNTMADGTGTTYAAGTGIFSITQNTMLYAKWVKFELRDIGPAGGLIFYDKGSFSNGWRYLEAAPRDYDNKEPFGYYYVNGNVAVVGTKTEIGEGKNNTALLVSHLTTPGAAKYCSLFSITYGGSTYNDWFLPSYHELEAMYKILYKDSNYANFKADTYWSSSEWSTGNRSFTWIFSDNMPGNWTNGGEFWLRFARQF